MTPGLGSKGSVALGILLSTSRTYTPVPQGDLSGFLLKLEVSSALISSLFSRILGIVNDLLIVGAAGLVGVRMILLPLIACLVLFEQERHATISMRPVVGILPEALACTDDAVLEPQLVQTAGDGLDAWGEEGGDQLVLKCS